MNRFSIRTFLLNMKLSLKLQIFMFNSVCLSGCNFFGGNVISWLLFWINNLIFWWRFLVPISIRFINTIYFTRRSVGHASKHINTYFIGWFRDFFYDLYTILVCLWQLNICSVTHFNCLSIHEFLVFRNLWMLSSLLSVCLYL